MEKFLCVMAGFDNETEAKLADLQNTFSAVQLKPPNPISPEPFKLADLKPVLKQARETAVAYDKAAEDESAAVYDALAAEELAKRPCISAILRCPERTESCQNQLELLNIPVPKRHVSPDTAFFLFLPNPP